MKKLICALLAGLMALQGPIAVAAGEDSGAGGGDGFESTQDDSERATGGRREDDSSDINEITVDVVGPELTSPQWDWELIGDNPILKALLGKAVNEITEESLSQSFSEALVRNPWALFLDLNGNGVNGDLWDGLMYNLFWGGLYGGNYISASPQNGFRSQFRPSLMTFPRPDSLRMNLTTTNVLLVSPLSDGRKYVALKDLAGMVENTDLALPLEDRKVALSTLALLALANPLMTTGIGPLLSPFSNKSARIAASLRSDLVAQVLGRPSYQGGDILTLHSSINRFATILAMSESLLNHAPDAGMSEETLLAVRGALYFLGFEIKRLRVNKSVRNQIFKTLVHTMAMNAPQTMKIVATEATSKVAMSNLLGVVKNIPLPSTEVKNRRGVRIAGSLVAFGVVMILWLKGVAPGLLDITRGGFAGYAGTALGGMALPSFAGLVANWLIRPRVPRVLDRDVRAFYEALTCEKELMN